VSNAIKRFCCSGDTLGKSLRYRSAAVGDLNERFAIEGEKLRRERAVRLYWARTILWSSVIQLTQ